MDQILTVKTRVRNLGVSLLNCISILSSYGKILRFSQSLQK
jgi:hypothetical protein